MKVLIINFTQFRQTIHIFTYFNIMIDKSDELW